jgi:SAM-dependent methyltransferase
MKAYLKKIYEKEMFFPTWIGIFTNPFYFARNGLAKAMLKYSKHLSGNLIDVGCGSQPYRKMFKVEEYTGLEFDSPIARERGIADVYYDGTVFPLKNEQFDSVICSQVLEHVFNPDEFLAEIHRVLKPGGCMVLTIPFVWDEHEQPYDYARYSSFGLKSLLEKSGFSIIEQEKICADVTVLFQLTNAYLFKITNNMPTYPRLIFNATIMAFVTMCGLFANLILPKNPDLFLDQIILVTKK